MLYGPIENKWPSVKFSLFLNRRQAISRINDDLDYRRIHASLGHDEIWYSLVWIKGQVENEDVVGAAPTGDTPTISEWSTFLLPIKMYVMLEVLR